MFRDGGRIISVALLLFLGFSVSRAYDEKTTHPALTSEVVDFYNASFPDKKITPEQKEWIIEGSILEDTAPRWINHFYDPVRNEGWTGEKEGRIPPSVLQKLSSIGLSTEDPLSAPEWLNTYLTQEAYSSYGGNRTWKKGMEYYAAGDEKQAYETLGHALHLLEDMSVPEHTRNDSHAPVMESLTGEDGSPYEQYSAKWTRDAIGELHIASGLSALRLTPPALYAPSDYLTAVAKYSNAFFVSKDTINDPKYALPKIIREDDDFGYGKDEDGLEFPLVHVKEKNNSLEIEKIYSITKSDSAILDAYFSRLSKKAVLYGAGMARLFQNDAADAVVNKEFPQHIVELDTSKLVLPNFSLVGLLEKAGGQMSGVIAAVRSFFGTVANVATQSLHEAVRAFNDLTVAKNGSATISSALPANFSSDTSPPSTPASDAFALADAPHAPSPASSEYLKNQLDMLASRLMIFQKKYNTSTSFEAPIVSSSLEFFGGSRSVILATGGGAEIPRDHAPDTSVGEPTGASASVSAGSSSPSQSLATSTAPVLLDGETNFVRYNPDTFQLEFRWKPSPYFGSSSSVITYQITDISSSTTASSTLIAETASTSYVTFPSEMGRDFTFSLSAVGDDGAESSSSVSLVQVPSFLKSMAWYRDPRPEGNGRYVLDMVYPRYPFIPPLHGNSWQGMVYYYDTLPNYANIYLPLAENWQPHDKTNTVTTPQGNVSLFGISPESSNGAGGGNLNNASFYLSPEDSRLVQFGSLPESITPTTSDFITIAYYDFYHSGGGTQDLELSIPDNTKYYFSSSVPSSSAPTAPGDLSAVFSPNNMMVTLSWAASSDSDSPDGGLRYQINYTTSTSFDDASWNFPAPLNTPRTVVIPVSFPNSYRIAVRAVDEWGNVSPPAIITWDFPAGFFPVARQLQHADLLMSPNGSGQKITLFGATALRQVALWGRADYSYDFYHAQSAVEIHADAGGGIGALLATSDVVDTTSNDGEHEIGYNFSPSLTLDPGSYWLVPVATNGGVMKFYGAFGNLYPEGQLGADGSADADLYFRIIE